MAYPHFPVPADEEQRLRELDRLGLGDGGSNAHFDLIVGLASRVLHAPIALISLVEADRQVFQARVGTDVDSTPRSMAFCAHTIAEDGVLVVPDAREDERFRDNPLVSESPGIRFYAGAPLSSGTGHNLGTLCVLDTEPRQLDSEQIELLKSLSALVMREFELLRQRRTCPLTGALRRKPFLSLAEHELSRCRSLGRPLTLLLLDLDNFATINNRWGHAAGDHILGSFAALCRDQLREEHLFARIGDVEFALLLPGCNPDEALATAERLRMATHGIDGVFRPSAFHATVSGGLTNLAGSDAAFVDLLRRAEEALVLAKSNGRDQIVRLEKHDGAVPSATGRGHGRP